nr:MAG TPA: hypothetical protein [Bacteriophage sp.]
MDEIKAFMNLDFPTVILGVFAAILGIDKIIFLFRKIKKTLRIKFGFEEDKETLDKRIATLEKHDNWQYKEITKISQGIDDIKFHMDANEKENNQRIIVQYGAELYNLHSKFMEQKYVTRAGLETFDLLAQTYLKCGGNHSIKGKIIPEVMALPIHDD